MTHADTALAADTLVTHGLESLDWDKTGGLIPGVIQDARTEAVLMVGWFNRESLTETLTRRRVVFYSRSKQRLWEKGETSGHTLVPESITADCDHDTLLLRVRPAGPACHRGTTTCFGDGEPNSHGVGFLAQLEQILTARITDKPEGSYTAKLYAQGPRRMAQKVGEEGVEVALASTSGELQELISESADLLFHLALLLRSRGLSLTDVTAELAARHRTRGG
jgi:phosphoribosyl-ATP pyrophosphohydrolase/phosphoribosyl-AMP cyclohydrolase